MESSDRRSTCGDNLCCPFCNVRVFNIAFLLSHLRFAHAHAHDPNFLVTCRLNGCPKTYSKYTSFHSHVYRHQKDHISQSAPGNSASMTEEAVQNNDTIENLLLSPSSVLDKLDEPCLGGATDVDIYICQIYACLP